MASPAGATRGDRPAESTSESRARGGSRSDPDGNSNGGKDKPGHEGGYDADKDWNNGCGDDADREDDNNGWCGRKPADEQSDGGTDDCECSEDADGTVITPALRTVAGSTPVTPLALTAPAEACSVPAAWPPSPASGWAAADRTVPPHD